MDAGLAGLERFIATPEVAKHRLLIWMPAGAKGSGSAYSIARDDDTTFGILHSRFHEVWSLRMGTSLEDRPRYTPSTNFTTFPFPEGLTPVVPAADDPRAQAIGAAARELYHQTHRKPPLVESCVPLPARVRRIGLPCQRSFRAASVFCRLSVFMAWPAFVARTGYWTDCPFPRADLSCGFRDGDAESGVAVEHGDADLELGDLAIEIARHEALTQQFHAMHLRLDAAPAVVSGPTPP